MRQQRTDRRSARTRRLLMGALMDLMLVKRYDAITVQEITDRADVGRSTFYAHFTDKDALLVDGARQMIGGLPAGDGAHVSLALLRHIGARAEMYVVMSRGRGLPLFLDALHRELTAVYADRLAARASAPPAVPLPLLAAMVSSMLLTALRGWLEAGAAEPPETVDRAFRTAADAAIRAGLAPA
ncbi:Bacterial regulatory protein, tetR family [Actinomadura rubteroloni]|uniref:Bacterial regulatory protein, tetR family n=1 Tax=Actinomadura rubteroloni TaxID=1926885 RepID=A0A2P4UDL7_9ACTN|nr:TetR/AcrR family transcriptional regulator [Actinomadura rubteroloni]POM23147.1 Bacterial regulatory protein, tetR family [Actinomadura rubteroloni]